MDNPHRMVNTCDHVRAFLSRVDEVLSQEVTIAILSYFRSSKLIEKADTLSVMKLQVSRSRRKVFSQLAAVSLLGLCSISLSAQQPVKDSGADSIAGKSRARIVVPVVKTGLTPPVYTDPLSALRSARMIHVKSTSIAVGVAVIEAKLQKRPEFSQLGLLITRNEEEADLILVVEHDLFTKYTYTAIHKDTNIVVASGKLSSLGGTVAGKVAERFLKQVFRARATAPGS